MSELQHVLDGNREWAEARRTADPDYFETLAAGQDPNVLWIGCADSRVPPNTITGLGPGELFVHRNIANLVLPADPNFLACLEYAVAALRVDHVVVCGHTGCGGVGAALEGADLDHVSDWIREIERVKRAHEEELASIESPRERVNRLSELNVEAQVESLAQSKVVQNARKNGQSPMLHGWMFRLDSGEIEDLGVSRGG